MAAEDLIEGIVSELHSRTYSKRDVERVVKWEVQKILPAWLSQDFLYGLHAANRKHAVAIRGIVLQLRQQIERLPPGTDRALFTLASRRYKGIAAFKEGLFTGLHELEQACAAICDRNNEIGDHHNRDKDKEICAGAALDLIVGLDAGRPTSSDINSPIRVIASLLYQSLRDTTAEPDLRNQCNGAAAQWRKMSPAERTAHIEHLRTTWAPAFTRMKRP
jgi:hypothetical protein